MTPMITALNGPAHRLGECPLWCRQSRRFWWVDVLTPGLFSHDPASGETRTHAIRARRLGSIALREAGGLLLACDDGLWTYDPGTGVQAFLCDPEPGVIGHRKNDGRSDPAGNFWIGTLREADYAPVGRIYRVGPDLNAEEIAGGMAIPNGLAFDAPGQRMYYCDTRAYRIMSRSLDPVSGALGPEQVFAETTAPARPDGACVDAEGYLWVAEYAGGRLLRYAPSGTLSSVIALPVSHPTCCAFGGDDLSTLCVTSAREPLSPEELAAEPLAGRTLLLRPGQTGRPEFLCAL